MFTNCEECKVNLSALDLHIDPLTDKWLCDACYEKTRPWKNETDLQQDGSQWGDA